MPTQPYFPQNPVPAKGKGISVRMPFKVKTSDKAKEAVTHADYSATHSLCTRRNAEKD